IVSHAESHDGAYADSHDGVPASRTPSAGRLPSGTVSDSSTAAGGTTSRVGGTAVTPGGKGSGGAVGAATGVVVPAPPPRKVTPPKVYVPPPPPGMPVDLSAVTHGTSWKVAAYDDRGFWGGYGGPPYWEFHSDGTVNSADLWRGRWTRVSP